MITTHPHDREIGPLNCISSPIHITEAELVTDCFRSTTDQLHKGYNSVHILGRTTSLSQHMPSIHELEKSVNNLSLICTALGIFYRHVIPPEVHIDMSLSTYENAVRLQIRQNVLSEHIINMGNLIHNPYHMVNNKQAFSEEMLRDIHKETHVLEAHSNLAQLEKGFFYQSSLSRERSYHKELSTMENKPDLDWAYNDTTFSIVTNLIKQALKETSSHRAPQTPSSSKFSNHKYFGEHGERLRSSEWTQLDFITISLNNTYTSYLKQTACEQKKKCLTDQKQRWFHETKSTTFRLQVYSSVTMLILQHGKIGSTNEYAKSVNMTLHLLHKQATHDLAAIAASTAIHKANRAIEAISSYMKELSSLQADQIAPLNKDPVIIEEYDTLAFRLLDTLQFISWCKTGLTTIQERLPSIQSIQDAIYLYPANTPNKNKTPDSFDTKTAISRILEAPSSKRDFSDLYIHNISEITNPQDDATSVLTASSCIQEDVDIEILKINDLIKSNVKGDISPTKEWNILDDYEIRALLQQATKTEDQMPEVIHQIKQLANTLVFAGEAENLQTTINSILSDLQQSQKTDNEILTQLKQKTHRTMIDTIHENAPHQFPPII